MKKSNHIHMISPYLVGCIQKMVGVVYSHYILLSITSNVVPILSAR